MINKLEEINNFPEYPEKETIEEFCNFVINESIKEPLPDTFDKLLTLGEKQWHTYELPSERLRSKLKKWLIDNWISNSNEYIENLLALCARFALDKELFTKALELYTGKHKKEFEKTLNNSKGNDIDPWWDMKK